MSGIVKYIFGVLSLLVVITVGVILFTGRKATNTSPLDQKPALTSYAETGATVTYTVYGEINADTEHRAIRIKVSRYQATIEILQGYEEKVISSKTYANNQAAFESFLYALRRAGFDNKQTARYDTVKGVCPNGTRSVYTVVAEDNEQLNLWSSSCSRKDGSFGGASSTVKSLFQKQIPDYREIVRGIRL